MGRGRCLKKEEKKEIEGLYRNMMEECLAGMNATLERVLKYHEQKELGEGDDVARG